LPTSASVSIEPSITVTPHGNRAGLDGTSGRGLAGTAGTREKEQHESILTGSATNFSHSYRARP
jgi:ribosomal protein L15